MSNGITEGSVPILVISMRCCIQSHTFCRDCSHREPGACSTGGRAGGGQMSCPHPKSFSRNPEVIAMAQALSVGLMGQQNETYPSWLFQCAAATRAISF